MVERETVKEDGTVVRRCESAGKHMFDSMTFMIFYNESCTGSFY